MPMVTWMSSGGRTGIRGRSSRPGILFIRRDLFRRVVFWSTFLRFSRTKQITKDDIGLLVSREIEPKIFSTIDALAARDRKLATKLLAEHLTKGESPIQLLSMFAWQFRILLSLKDLVERGVEAKEIEQKLKLHPFVFHKSFYVFVYYSPFRIIFCFLQPHYS